MARMNPLYLDTTGLKLEQMEQWGKDLNNEQKSINWWIGDLAIAAKALLGEDNYSQVFPIDISIGLVQRCEAVARAYSPQERNPGASWTIHMKHKNNPNRVALVAAAVAAGRTSDEERKANQASKMEQDDNQRRWLLAVDVNYFLHRFWFSGAGVESAVAVSEWIGRTVERLKEKNLSDLACCLDSHTNHRKELTLEWEDKYKDRPTKDPELANQLRLVHELLQAKGFACISQEGMEADDCMASFAKQFDGHVTLLTQDKDCRQCLSPKCNMLLDVEWIEDPTSGEMLPDYKWLSTKLHLEQTSLKDKEGKPIPGTGIDPSKWVEFQCLMGDATDGIKGAVGIGKEIAANLVRWFGTAEAAIQAAKDDDPRITKAKREALIEFESKLEITRKLVTLRTDLPLPAATKI